MASEYSKTLLSILRRSGTRRVDLSLDQEEDYQAVRLLLGGDHGEQKLPKLHRILKESTVPVRSALPRDSAATPGAQDLIMIRDAAYSPGNNEIYTSGRISLLKPTARLYCSQIIFNEKGDEIARNSLFINNKSTGDIYCNLPNVPAELLEKKIKVLLHVVYEASTSENDCRNGSDKPVLRSTVLEKETTAYVGDVILMPLEIHDPRFKGTYARKEGSINVCFARFPTAGEIADYYKREWRDKGEQRFLLESSGSAILKKGYTFKKVDPLLTGIVMDLNGQGGFLYNKDAVSDNFRIDTIVIGEESYSRLSWSFDEDWNTVIPDSVMTGSRQYYYELQLPFTYTTPGKEEKEHSLMVSSYNYPQQANSTHYKKIPTINLLWGCIAEGSLVTMEDLREVPVEDIRIGDRILTSPQEGSSIVVNTWRGTESELWCVKARGLQPLWVSKTHPFMTTTGPKPACELESSDSLITLKGNLPVEYRYPQPCNAAVYNLDLEETHTFLGNGYCIGDNHMQNEINPKDGSVDMLDASPEYPEEVKLLRELFFNI